VPLFRRRAADLDTMLEKVPDDLPKAGLFVEPVVVALQAPQAEALDDGSSRVTFRVTVKDAEGKRCPDVYVEATIAGPERTATGSATTDLMGQARFRMTGPAGRYAITVEDVAAGALRLDRDASVLDATTVVG
jgi:hypothetical protein